MGTGKIQPNKPGLYNAQPHNREPVDRSHEKAMAARRKKRALRWFKAAKPGDKPPGHIARDR